MSLSNRKKISKKDEQSLRNLWDTIKPTNIYIFGNPRRRREKETEEILEEIIAEYFPKLMKYIKINNQEAQ